MTNVFKRMVRFERVEYVIPCGESGGCWNEVQLAIHWAHQLLEARGELSAGEQAADDQIRVKPGDDEVIVFVEFENKGLGPNDD